MDYSQLSDEELMAVVAERRGDALEALYDRYAGLVYSLAVRVLGDRGAAEEVVQDVFVSVWQKAQLFDPERGRLYTWLVRIARNRAIDELRRGKNRARDGRLRLEVVPETPEPVEVDSARGAEFRSMITGAMDELPANQREVLELAYLKGLSQREISELTGVPLGTVKTRTRLALKKLRDILEPMYGGSVNLDGV